VNGIMSKLTYFKRYRMELDLRREFPAPRLPHEFGWLEWDEHLLEAHAETKYLCFQQEVDALVFPSLSHYDGCRDLMTAIRCRYGFCPGATWLVAAPDGCVGTVQGVIDEDGFGAIQNLGVLAEHRGRGLGRALLLKALHGFKAAGVKRSFLEVTATNESAMGMYRGLGYRCRRTVYRGVVVPELITLGLGI
jgi:ribosomal protein S18 acetylase RimI-like enzyme